MTLALPALAVFSYDLGGIAFATGIGYGLTTDAANNEPWDEASATGTTPNLNATNLKYGRRFKVVQTRWLTPNEL